MTTKTMNRKAQRNAYADACASLGLNVAEVHCLIYSTEPGGDPVLWCEGRTYEFFGVDPDGYAIPEGEPVVGPPPKIRFLIEGMPKMAMHWRR
jgi:hypothetical protein